jgi:hypothetical protein
LILIVLHLRTLCSDLIRWGDDQPGDCVYSFNPDLSALGQICTQDYPYCIGGDCKKLTASPWLNRGIDPDEFATFMSWVPLVSPSVRCMARSFDLVCCTLAFNPFFGVCLILGRSFSGPSRLSLVE